MPSFVSGVNLLQQAGVSLASVGDVVGLSGRNLLTSSLAEVWRTAGNAGSVSADLGAAQAAQAIVLAAPRDGLLPAAGSTLRITASSISAAGAEIYDSGTITWSMSRGYQAVVLTTPLSARYWRLTLSGADAQPYLQLGRLWIGPGVYVANYLTEGGYTPSLFDAEASPVRRQMQFELTAMSQGQADGLEDIALAIGTQAQGLFVPRVERSERTAVFGRLTSIPAPRPLQQWSAGAQLHSASLTVQEDR